MNIHIHFTCHTSEHSHTFHMYIYTFHIHFTYISHTCFHYKTYVLLWFSSLLSFCQCEMYVNVHFENMWMFTCKHVNVHLYDMWNVYECSHTFHFVSYIIAVILMYLYLICVRFLYYVAQLFNVIVRTTHIVTKPRCTYAYNKYVV